MDIAALASYSTTGPEELRRLLVSRDSDIEGAHHRLDMLGVPRSRQSEQGVVSNLTVVGRLELLDEAASSAGVRLDRLLIVIVDYYTAALANTRARRRREVGAAKLRRDRP
jgi:hypothetical protein